MSCQKLQIMQNELNAILNNKNAVSNDYNTFFNKWGINYKNNTSVKNIAQCTGINAAIGSNNLEITQSCVDEVKNLCLSLDSNGEGSRAYDNCMKLYRPTLSNINQSNKNTITSNCVVSSILKDPILSKNKELALLLNMDLAKYKINCNDYKINNSLSSDDKTISVSDCLSYNIANQQNIISACYVSDVIQNNISNIISDCIIKAGDVPSDASISQSKSTSLSSPSSDNKTNTQNNLNFFNNNEIISYICCCCCCCISIIIIIFIIKKKF